MADLATICVGTTSFVCGLYRIRATVWPQNDTIGPQTATEAHFFENPWDRPNFGCNSLNAKDLFVPFTRGTSMGQDGTEITKGRLRNEKCGNLSA